MLGESTKIQINETKMPSQCTMIEMNEIGCSVTARSKNLPCGEAETKSDMHLALCNNGTTCTRKKVVSSVAKTPTASEMHLALCNDCTTRERNGLISSVA